MAFTKKRIDLTFTLGAGQFGETGSNQVTVSGLRVLAKVIQAGGVAQNTCQLRVFGLTPTVYNALTSIYPLTTAAIRRNTVQVMAGDAASGSTLPAVFIGQIVVAQIDLNGQPDNVLNVIANSSTLIAVQPIPASSYPNGVAVATVMRSLATAANRDFEDNAVTDMLPKCYLHGTALQQMRQVVDMVPGLGFMDDGVKIAIWPKGGYRKSVAGVPLVSYEDDMIGYPSYSNIGIGVRCLYRPDIQFMSKVQIASSLAQVRGLNGFWTAYNIVHTLESEMPDGQWQTEFQGQNLQAVSE